MYDIAIIGAGLAGISAALKAQQEGIKNVVLIEQGDGIGGFTRAYHSSAEFAKEQRLMQEAGKLHYPIWCKSTAMGLFVNEREQHSLLYIQTATETKQIAARTVLIATGSMEMPKEARKIPGGRPAGVMTPFLAAQLLSKRYRLGKRIAVFDTGRLSRSVLPLLAEHGYQVTVFDGQGADLVHTKGTARLEAIGIYDLNTMVTSQYPCDTLIYCKGRYGATFFLKGTDIKRSPRLAVYVDDDGYTGLPGIYGAGTCTVSGDDDHLHSIADGEKVMTHLLAQRG